MITTQQFLLEVHQKQFLLETMMFLSPPPMEDK